MASVCIQALQLSCVQSEKKYVIPNRAFGSKQSSAFTIVGTAAGGLGDATLSFILKTDC